LIVVDTSALMAILLDEPEGRDCIDVLEAEAEVVISAGTLAEALIVASRRGFQERMALLVEGLGCTVAPVTEETARAVGRAYDAFGKGMHRARLNFGDCFAYQAATSRGCPLLFVGDDFTRTNVIPAIFPKPTGFMSDDRASQIMSGDLFGRDEATRPVERLFFGLMLPASASQEAVSILAHSQDEHDLRGAPVRRDRLHVTLIHVGDYAGMPPQSVIEALRHAAETVTLPTFKVVFDLVSSFSGAPGRHPHVLLGNDGLEPLKAFRSELLKAVIRQGVKPLSREAFTPHVTLSYADRRLPERPIRPIAWRAAEFVLIHSEVGRSIYHTLGRWPLR